MTNLLNVILQTLNLTTTQLLYTIKEVAKIFKTNVSYIHRLRKVGLLKCLKLGSYKVSHKTIEQFLQKYEGYDLSNPSNIKEEN